MNDLLTAIFLGFIEGLTEFIPVSSTAHLVMLVDWLNFPAPPGRVFEVFIQLGAILAVVVLYHRKFIYTALHLHSDPAARHFVLLLIIATIPALIVGALGRDFIKTHLYTPPVIAAALIIGGIIILVLDKHFQNPKITSADHVPLKTGFIIGCFQALALMPGVSRSGATIIGALSLRLSRPAAAELSFFMAVPVMFAAVTYDVLKSWHDIIATDALHLMLAGFAAAFITAMVVIKLALNVISRFGFAPFAWYRIGFGILILLMML